MLANLLGTVLAPHPPPICLSLRGRCRSLCYRIGRLEARTVWLLNVVIDMDHIIVVAECLDEMGSLLQVGVSQPHLCVGDEL